MQCALNQTEMTNGPVLVQYSVCTRATWKPEASRWERTEQWSKRHLVSSSETFYMKNNSYILGWLWREVGVDAILRFFSPAKTMSHIHFDVCTNTWAEGVCKLTALLDVSILFHPDSASFVMLMSELLELHSF